VLPGDLEGDDEEEIVVQREVSDSEDEDGEEPMTERPRTIVVEYDRVLTEEEVAESEPVQLKGLHRPKRREVKRREGSVQEQMAMIIARRAVELGDDRRLFTVYEMAKIAWQEAPGVFGMLDGEYPCSHTTAQTLMRARRNEMVLFIDDKYGARDEYLERARRER
jgi:hypothetical protein